MDCLGTNNLLMLLLHCADWEFQTGHLLFHGFVSLTKNSFQFFVRRAILCNSAFFVFVRLELSGKKYKLSMFPRDPLDSIFQTLP